MTGGVWKPCMPSGTPLMTWSSSLSSATGAATPLAPQVSHITLYGLVCEQGAGKSYPLLCATAHRSCSPLTCSPLTCSPLTFAMCPLLCITAHCCAAIAGRFDVPIPPMQPAKQSDHVASMLYIADFLTQFTKVLAIQPITFQELSACLHPNTPTNALLEPSATAVAPRGAVRPAAVGSVARGAATAAAANGVTAPVSNGTIPNGPVPNGAAKGADAITAAGGEALFGLYRGLLQFLLQVMHCTATLKAVRCHGKMHVLTPHCIDNMIRVLA